MGITSEKLIAEIESLRAQQANALAVAQQAQGAISLCESLLAHLEAKDHLTMSELKEMTGAKEITVERAS